MLELELNYIKPGNPAAAYCGACMNHRTLEIRVKDEKNISYCYIYYCQNHSYLKDQIRMKKLNDEYYYVIVPKFNHYCETEKKRCESCNMYTNTRCIKYYKIGSTSNVYYYICEKRNCLEYALLKLC